MDKMTPAIAAQIKKITGLDVSGLEFVPTVNRVDGRTELSFGKITFDATLGISAGIINKALKPKEAKSPKAKGAE